MNKFSEKDLKKPYQREVYDALRGAEDGGLTVGEAFSRWVYLLFMAQKQGAIRMATGLLDEALEKEFLREQSRAKHPDRYAEASALLVEALEVESYDFLGSFAAIVGKLDGKLGQFYTPAAICKLMCETTLMDFKKPDDGHRMKIQEPACGGGAMLIAMTNILKERGFYPWHYYIQAIDISALAYQMCYIQLNLLGVPADVYRGNMLKGEIYDSAPTMALVLHPLSKEERAQSNGREGLIEADGQLAMQF